jgi:hypothetical protein
MFFTEFSSDQPDAYRCSSSVSGSSLASSRTAQSTQSTTLSEIDYLLQQDLTPNKRAIVEALLGVWHSRHTPKAYVNSSHLRRAS